MTLNGTRIDHIAVRGWDQSVPCALAAHAIDSLERGGVLRLPLGFELGASEGALLEARLLQGSRKNISWNPSTGRLKGVGARDARHDLLTEMLRRYHAASRGLALALFPAYQGRLQDGRSSFRPAEIAGRDPKSWRKDDTRVHVDAFPATPTQGRRLLRVFTNLNPQGEPRRWLLGEPFAEVAARFLPRIARHSRVRARLLSACRLTRSPRSAYDHYMLGLHDGMKADLSYQQSLRHAPLEFAAGETWIVYSDQVSHAVLSGRCLLEQTFYLPVEAQRFPERSPLRVLEGLVGHPLL